MNNYNLKYHKYKNKYLEKKIVFLNSGGAEDTRILFTQSILSNKFPLFNDLINQLGNIKDLQPTNTDELIELINKFNESFNENLEFKKELFKLGMYRAVHKIMLRYFHEDKWNSINLNDKKLEMVFLNNIKTLTQLINDKLGKFITFYTDDKNSDVINIMDEHKITIELLKHFFETDASIYYYFRNLYSYEELTSFEELYFHLFKLDELIKSYSDIHSDRRITYGLQQNIKIAYKNLQDAYESYIQRYKLSDNFKKKYALLPDKLRNLLFTYVRSKFIIFITFYTSTNIIETYTQYIAILIYNINECITNFNDELYEDIFIVFNLFNNFYFTYKIDLQNQEIFRKHSQLSILIQELRNKYFDKFNPFHSIAVKFYNDAIASIQEKINEYNKSYNDRDESILKIINDLKSDTIDKNFYTRPIYQKLLETIEGQLTKDGINSEFKNKLTDYKEELLLSEKYIFPDHQTNKIPLYFLK